MSARRSIDQFRRGELESRIEEMIALLDLIDGDPDLEDGADDEPSLDGHAKYRNGRLVYDLEADDADDEPSLGWNEAMNQLTPERFGPLGSYDLEADAGCVYGGTGL